MKHFIALAILSSSNLYYNMNNSRLPQDKRKQIKRIYSCVMRISFYVRFIAAHESQLKNTSAN